MNTTQSELAIVGACACVANMVSTANELSDDAFKQSNNRCRAAMDSVIAIAMGGDKNDDKRIALNRNVELLLAEMDELPNSHMHRGVLSHLLFAREASKLLRDTLDAYNAV